MGCSPGGGTPIIILVLYGYVLLEMVWFSSHLLWDRVYPVVIIENWSRTGSHLTELLSRQKL